MYQSLTRYQQQIKRVAQTPPATIILKQNAMINESFEYILTKTHCNNIILRNDKFKMEHLFEALKNVKQWSISNQLLVNFNEIPVGRERLREYSQYFLQIISDINFPYLKVLNLKNCQIYSVEMLCRVSSPSLVQLYLNQSNPIVDIRSLRKCDFKNLDLIYLPKYIMNMHQLIEMDAPNLGSIFLDQAEQWASQSTWIFKLQNLSTCYIQHKGCLRQEGIKKLSKKFYQLSIKRMVKYQQNLHNRGFQQRRFRMDQRNQ